MAGLPEERTMEELVERVARAIYDRVKSVLTMTYDIAYPDEQQQFRYLATIALTAADVPRLLRVEAAARARGQRHGTMCECDGAIRAALDTPDPERAAP
jgi:hypothetical protein